MRRTELKRKTPLRPKAFNDNGTRRYSSLKRTSMKRRRTTKAEAKLTPYEKAYRAYTRKLPCCRCRRSGPNQAAHVQTGAGQKGTGIKVPNEQIVPLCGGPRGCHAWYDGHAGVGPTRDERRELAVKWLKLVENAVTPEDRDDALALRALGLGYIEELGGGKFAWHEGSQPEEEKVAA